MKRLLQVIIFSVVIGTGHICYSQVPTDQDCLGAIPICSYFYSTTNAYYGEGNYLNEHPLTSCTYSGEYNSAWFVFTVQQSGNLAFTLTPTPSAGSDYDWFLYNLTNASCSDIPTNSSLMVSCNASQWGITGISAGGVGNWNGPGWTNAYNYLYPVLIGETYVLNISNWNATTGGFNLNFINSTAVLFDTIKPVIQTLQIVGCTSTSLTFTFSENILCNTVSDADFTLTGPGGPFTLSGVTSTVCAAGGDYDLTYTIDISPPIMLGGTYDFNLVSSAGSVTDLCGNIALPATVQFTINAPTATIDSIIEPICLGGNGIIYANGINGTLPFQFSIDGSSFQSSGMFDSLFSGLHIITVQDAGGCEDTIQINLQQASGLVSASIVSSHDVYCNDSCDGWINTAGAGGNPPYTYSWTNTSQTSDNIIDLCPNNYLVTITDQDGCWDTVSVTLIEPPAINFSVAQLNDASCNGYADGSVTIDVTGATPGYNYSWAIISDTDSSANNLGAGNYTLNVVDANGCNYSFDVTISEPAPLVIIPYTDTSICNGTYGDLYADISGGTLPYSVVWDNGSFVGNPYSVNPPSSQTYVAFVTDANGCTSETEDYEVLVIDLPVVNIGVDTVICDGDVFTRNAYFAGANYDWNDGTSTSTYDFSLTGIYYVDVSNMCATARDSLLVEVYDCESCVHAPNAFTPNQDGLNDIFLPQYTCNMTSFLLKVFNRWGELVFYSTDPVLGWDGTHNSLESELGTYVWYLDYEGLNYKGLPVAEHQQGNVILLR